MLRLDATLPTVPESPTSTYGLIGRLAPKTVTSVPPAVLTTAGEMRVIP